MLSRKELRALGSLTVSAMRIGRKWNSVGISKARKFFPRAQGFFKNFDGKTLSEKQLAENGVKGRTLEKLLYPDYGPLLVKVNGTYSVRGTIGESVRLRYHPDNWPLAKEILLAAARKGAHVSYTPHDSALDREMLLESTRDALEDFTPMAQAGLKTVDVTIYLENEDDPAWKDGIPLARLKSGRGNTQRVHEILDSRKVRWLYLGWPFPLTAKTFGVKPAWFDKMVFSSLEESFSSRTKKLVEYYYNALEGADKVRITHEDGSDLSFSVKGRPPLKDAGEIAPEQGDYGLNLPSGESFISPLEHSAEGVIKFDKILAIGHGFVEGLKLTFRGGRVADFSARKNAQHFAKYLKDNTESTRVLAELGIGCNSAAKYSGYILTDEKIAGTIHLAIGNNTGSYHGKNKASGHLDMVKDMRRGVLWIDGKAVMKGGTPARPV